MRLREDQKERIDNAINSLLIEFEDMGLDIVIKNSEVYIGKPIQNKLVAILTDDLRINWIS